MADEDKKLHTEILREVLKTSKDTKECVTQLQNKVALHIQATEYELKAINRTNETQNKILEEHHKRSDAIQKDNALREEKLRMELYGERGVVSTFEERLKKIEEPRIAWGFVAKTVIGLGAMAAAIFSIIKLFS